MNDYRWNMLWDARRADLEREVEQDRLAIRAGRRINWRALLVAGVILIGMFAWLIH